MINIKSKSEIEKMKDSGKIVAEVLNKVEENILPGITTKELDRIASDYIIKSGAFPSFLGVPNYYGGVKFPGAICASVNGEIIHGIPDGRHLKEGDIISVDVGAFYNGFHGDAARTFPVGKVSEAALKLIEVTRQSFFEGLKFVRPNNRVSDVSGAIQDYAESFGYSIVKEYTGHGVGRELHEDPEVPNYRTNRRGHRLAAGMAIAIEPMVNQGTADIVLSNNKWTVYTKDGKLSAHYENTVIVTEGEPLIVTI
ncbi:MAG: type I methionyl aminopeptidase [Clostridiales bacterium]|jgi:methionine aminopeptidase, type I|nr:type I methionyl aminopeptidase [Clostridiales bacterium]